jgi:hypothetical protein
MLAKIHKDKNTKRNYEFPKSAPDRYFFLQFEHQFHLQLYLLETCPRLAIHYFGFKIRQLYFDNEVIRNILFTKHIQFWDG